MEQLTVIAKIHTMHKDKFGIPRQSGMVDLPAEIVFEPQFRDPNAVRGLDGFSHIWLLWQFSEAKYERWQPTVRPPRLGGNTRMGVFATRSPFRPNSIGLSSVKLERVELTSDRGPVLHISGADILDGTPIYDVKPYIAFCDSHPEAVCGFTESYKDYKLEVKIPETEAAKIPDCLKQQITDLLACDPRPSYQADPDRVYALDVAGFNIQFSVKEQTVAVNKIAKNHK